MESQQLEILLSSQVTVQPYLPVSFKLKSKYIKNHKQKLRRLQTIIATRKREDSLDMDSSDAGSHTDLLLDKFMQSPSERIQLSQASPSP